MNSPVSRHLASVCLVASSLLWVSTGLAEDTGGDDSAEKAAEASKSCDWTAFKQDLDARRKEVFRCFADHPGADEHQGLSGLKVRWQLAADNSEPQASFVEKSAPDSARGKCITDILEELDVDRTDATTCRASFDLLYAPQSPKQTVAVDYRSFDPDGSSESGGESAQNRDLAETDTDRVFGRRRGLDRKVQAAEDEQPGPTEPERHDAAELPVDDSRLTTSETCRRGDLERSLEALEPLLLNCYRDHRRDNPDLSGGVTVDWTVDTAGKSGDVDLTDRDLGSDAVAACVVDVFEDLQFEAPDDTCEATFEIDFESDGE